MTLVTRTFTADFGPAFGGLIGTLGYSVNGGPVVTAGVRELAAGSGVYAADVRIDGAASGTILWTDGATPPATAVQDILPLWSLPVLDQAGADPDFVDACNAIVAIEVDANSNGNFRTRQKGIPRDFVAVPGQEARPVILGQLRTGSEDIDGRPVMTLAWQAMFPTLVELDIQHRLRWEDPDQSGLIRYLYVTGRSYNAFQINHHWYVPLMEYVEFLAR